MTTETSPGPIDTMLQKLSQLLGTIDGKLRNKLDKSGGTVDHLTVTARLAATADHAHALKAARVIALAGGAIGQVSFDGSENVSITVAIPAMDDKADKAVTYTKEEVDLLFQNLIGLAPAELDTIYELAAALKNNQDSIGTILTELSKKASKTDLAATNQELSTLITELTAAFVNGTNLINGV